MSLRELASLARVARPTEVDEPRSKRRRAAPAVLTTAPPPEPVAAETNVAPPRKKGRAADQPAGKKGRQTAAGQTSTFEGHFDWTGKLMHRLYGSWAIGADAVDGVTTFHYESTVSACNNPPRVPSPCTLVRVCVPAQKAPLIFVNVSLRNRSAASTLRTGHTLAGSRAAKGWRMKCCYLSWSPMGRAAPPEIRPAGTSMARGKIGSGSTSWRATCLLVA